MPHGKSVIGPRAMLPDSQVRRPFRISSARVASAVALVCAVTLVIAACGGAQPAEPEEASAPGVPEIANPTGPPRYRELVEDTFASLAAFWDRELPRLGGEAGTPKRLVSYRGAADDARCGGRPALARNAQYCLKNTSILWDANWVHGSLYRRFGDATVAFLLAHEYGHFVQDRLRIQNDFLFTIEGELHADCLAGVWMANAARREQRFRMADFAALYLGVFAVADPRGIPWTNPSAHGRAVERRRAVATGARRGAPGCMKAYAPGFSR